MAEAHVSVPPGSRAPFFLAGPTAAGKSQVALQLAEQIGGEIISVDSMQVYRGLDLGTAKPTLEERQRIPHHLIDILDLSGSFDAAQFVGRAGAAVAEIQARGRVPILCGGTGLYFKAFLEGIGQAPPADQALRAALEATPLPALLSELRRLDPLSFERIDRNNPRRVIRALEVIRLTGRPFSEQRAAWHLALGSPELRTRNSEPRTQFFCFSRAPDDLRQRIHARVDRMFQQGLVDETRCLLEQGLGGNKTALQALGYRQVTEYLQGQRSLAETIDLVKSRTRQFARRQLTWFRHQTPAKWIHLEADQPPESVAASLAESRTRCSGDS